MRTLITVAILVASTGCEVKRVEEHPEPGRNVVVTDRIPPSPVVSLRFQQLWDPRALENGRSNVDLQQMLAARHFAAHQTECLAAGIVGAAASLTPGGWNAIAAPTALVAGTPTIARTVQEKWKQGIVQVSSQGGSSVDATTSGPGNTSVRELVFRVKDEDLSARFEGFVGKIEEAVTATNARITEHRRGGTRKPAAISDLHYETPNRKGFVRTVTVYGHDENDQEFRNLMLDETPTGLKHMKPGVMIKSMISLKKGPYVVVYVKEENR